MTHVPVNMGDGFRCRRCGVTWDQGEDAPEMCVPNQEQKRQSVAAFLDMSGVRPPEKVLQKMNAPVDPMAVQIGGRHYKNLAIQPTEFCMRNGLDPCIHGAIKYIVRWRDKGGVEDLRKAVHYLQIRERFNVSLPTFPMQQITMVEFVQRNNIAMSETEALYRLEAYYLTRDLWNFAGAAQRAIDAIEAIIRAEEIKSA